MIKNMKVRSSLLIGYVITFAVSLLLIITCLVNTTKQQAQFDQIMDTYVYANELVTEIRLNANIAARNAREITIFPGTTTSAGLRVRADEVLKIVDKGLDELEVINPVRDGTVVAYIDSARDWMEAAGKVFEALDAGRADEAKWLIDQECGPHLDEMATNGSSVDNTLSQMVEDVRAQQAKTNRITIIGILIVLALALAAVITMALKIVTSISGPIEEVRNALVAFSEGNLDMEVTYESRNELGEMCDALRSSQDTLSSVIHDESWLLAEMGNGNFDIKSSVTEKYVGDLATLLESIRKINYSLSGTLSNLRENAEQVAAGADQVANGSQALAQGATEQASAVEELSATITDIANNAQKNAETSQLAMEHAQRAGTQIGESAQQMEQMVEAMGKISDSSEEIGKIIATIENIAFQTNILALNAAVEAARAGAAGKGFAVVADEVRNLAAKSDQAAKATKELIERSINAVKDGDAYMKSVSDSLDKTVELASRVVEDVQSISNAATEQSEAIVQVTTGLDQISAVVQTNSATSEESAAASEELSSQADVMKKEMEHFRLREDASKAQRSAAKPAAALPEGKADAAPAQGASKY